MKKYLFLLLTVICFSTWAQSPKRELRASWLATVFGIDWPNQDKDFIPKISSTGNQSQINDQKKMLIRILDSLVVANMNTVCFQARSRADAMYKSSYEPWSADLVTTRGMEPGYDPLEFVIEEGHKRGLQVYAWINPYRYESSAGQWTGSAKGDFRKEHPNWILDITYLSDDGKWVTGAIFDPGRPDVRSHILSVIEEIVTNYNIDGVLFDDYFYIKEIKDQKQDEQTYAQYNPDGLEISDWRRNNVNTLVKQVHDMIQAKKPYVSFGIGPAGIWDGSDEVTKSYGLTNPKGISGGFIYNGIYCDPLAWMQQGIVDYISPQIYWTIGSGTTDYAKLSPWWSNAALHFGKHCYVSHTIAKLDMELRSTGIDSIPEGLSGLERAIFIQNNSIPLRAFGPSEIGAQVGINRDADRNDAPGSVLYSTRFHRLPGFASYLKKDVFTYPSLPPAFCWKGRDDLKKVTGITLSARTLSWNQFSGDVRYSVYAIPRDQTGNPEVFNSSAYLLGFTYTPAFTIPTRVDLSSSALAVAVFDRYGNEYAPVILNENPVPAIAPALTFPQQDAQMEVPFFFQWESVSQAISYILEIATDEAFSQKVCVREVYTNTFPTVSLKPLVSGQRYYWRVRTKTIGNESVSSETRSFVNIFAGLKILTPTDLSENIFLTPQISWIDLGPDAVYQLDIATSDNFAFTNMVYSGAHQTSSWIVPEKLLVGMTHYYAKLTARLYDTELISPTIKFTTLPLVPDVPVILSPLPESTIQGENIPVSWKEDPKAKNFLIEMAADPSFPSRRTKRNLVNAYLYETAFTPDSSGIYYLRAAAMYNTQTESGSLLSTETPYSDAVKVNYTLTTALNRISNESPMTYISTLSSGQKQLTINLTTPAVVSISLYSVSGIFISDFGIRQQMLSGEQKIAIPSEGLPKGFYLLVVQIDGVRKILKYSF